MLKKRQRLSRSEFSTALKRGKRVRGDTLQVVSFPASELKCGVVVSKKTARSAVARTQLRRRIYAALGNITPLLANTHTIVLTTKQAAAQTTSELEAELRALIARLRPDSKGTTDAVE